MPPLEVPGYMYLLQMEAFGLPPLAMALPYGDRNLGERRLAYLLNFAIFWEFCVEIVLHVITGEIAPVHRIVDALKLIILIGMGIHAESAVKNGTQDMLYYVTLALVYVGAPATVLETYISYGSDHGATALGSIFGITLVFSMLLGQAMKGANEVKPIKKD